VERAGWSKALKYFSFSHLEVEKSHEVFEQEIARTVSSIRLQAAMRAEARELVDRCYAAFGAMFDALGATQAHTLAEAAAESPPLSSPAVRPRARAPRIDIQAVVAGTSPSPRAALISRGRRRESLDVDTKELAT
jgi:hypothetical protein